jgi:hypothetical protein
LPSGGVVAEGFKMNIKPNRQSKTFLALVLMLTISLIAGTQLTAVNAQTSGTVTINNGATYTNSTAVTLTLSANATDMCFSNDNSSWSSWENYTATKNWTIPNTEGAETVYVQFRDSSNQTATASANIKLDVTPPVPELIWEPYSTDYKTIRFSAYDYTTDSNGVQNATVNFGDGNATAITNSVFIHTYAAIGNYNVTLVMTDFAGNSASGSLTVTVPDVSTIATTTPAPTVTSQPTFNPTEQPTEQPTATAAPTTLDPLTMIVLVGAIGIIVVVIFAIILVLRRKPKPPKTQEQQSKPTQSPPPQQKPQPSTPAGPSESNFTI